jgi:hypothetical protein
MSVGGVVFSAHDFGLPLLDELPGESLFSHCARQHRMWGFTHASSTCNALFGSPRGGVHHDFPNSLARLEQRTHGAFGEASVLARRRTVLSFYVPFLAPDELEAAVHVMSGPSVAHLKYRLGLLTSRFRAHHPLKACDACMAADVKDVGWAYWHLMHQAPGVWTCPWHGNPLRESPFKANGVGAG